MSVTPGFEPCIFHRDRTNWNAVRDVQDVHTRRFEKADEAVV